MVEFLTPARKKRPRVTQCENPKCSIAEGSKTRGESQEGCTAVKLFHTLHYHVLHTGLILPVYVEVLFNVKPTDTGASKVSRQKTRSSSQGLICVLRGVGSVGSSSQVTTAHDPSCTNV